MKQAIFLIVSNGVDGRGPQAIEFASTDEADREHVFAAIKDDIKGYYSKTDRVIDLAEHKQYLLRKLDGLDTLVLNLPNHFLQSQKIPNPPGVQRKLPG